MKFSTLATRITDFADQFVPDTLKRDLESLNQARVFLISHLFGPVLGSAVPIALLLVDPTPSWDIVVLSGSILAFWVFPPLLRATGRYKLLTFLSVQNLFFCILWSCYFYGGIKSPTLPWVLIIPLLAFFYIGTSAFMRMLVIASFVVNVGIFVALYVLVPPPPNDIPVLHIEALGMVSTVAVSLYVAMMALYFAKVHESQSALEALVREHVSTAAALREATAQSERANAAKADFLAKMNHELRTPLNAIIGYSQILREEAEEENDPGTIADLDRIHGAGQQLLRIINDILDLAKIEAGKMEVFEELTSLRELVTSTAAAFAEAARARGNTLGVTVGEGVGSAWIDEKKVRQMLAQLIENAVKFTSGGEVGVEVGVEDGGPALVRFTVRDTGCGMSPEEQAAAFEHFTVVGDKSSSKYGGTGLGLALCRRLSRLLKGRITVASEPGKGSTFVVTLPYRSAADADGAPGLLARAQLAAA